MRLRRVLPTCCLSLFMLSLCASGVIQARAQHATGQRYTGTTVNDFAAVDPNYIYDQLFTMVTRFQRREAGYSTRAPDGHKGFANYWSQAMTQNLQGFGPQLREDSFAIHGWTGRPTISPAFNVEVSIPGAVHPEQVVVIGCHYDGEAVSTQSANDDGSGCAIELGIARALGLYWRQHQIYPARTLRFVLFDAEEQGVLGSFHYVNDTVNGDLNNIVAMFNEEQNGIAYPLRYLGQQNNPILPFNIEISPLNSVPQLYPDQDKLSQTQKASIARFHSLIQQAQPIVFAKFQALGYRYLTYHVHNKRDVAQPIFTTDQAKNIIMADDTLGGSDQIPFTLAGIPCATFVGNSSYYDQQPPPWSYPYDQKQDTIQLMNTFADGSSQKSNALALALAIPGMFTAWMLSQSEILGQISSDQLAADRPIIALSDVGITTVGRALALDARAAFVPTGDNLPITYSWNFGDGARASGTTVSHTYRTTGSYTLTLTASTATSQQSVSKIIHVSTRTYGYTNPYQQDIADQNGRPPSNPRVILPTPNNALSDRVSSGIAPVSHGQPQLFIGNRQASLAFIAVIGVALAVILIGCIVGVRLLSRKPPAT